LSSQYGTSTAISEDGNVTVIGMSELQEGEIKPSKGTKVLLSEKDKEALSLNRGDILLNRTNSYDLVGKVGIYESDEEAVFASYLVRLEVDRSKVVPEFLNFWLNSWRCQKTIKRIATRAISQANVNPTEFKKHCYVPLPPLAEQKNIVSIFSTLESLRKKTEQLISAKEKQFTALTQSLINIHCTDDNWPHIKTRSLLKSVTSKKHPNEPLLSVTQDRGVIPRDMLSGRVMSPAGSVEGYKLVEPGNFVISLRSFQGGIEYSEYRGIVSPAYTVLTNKKPIHADFYKHFFKSRIFIGKYMRAAIVGIRDGKQVSFPDLESIKIPYPPLDEQERISNTLNTAREEINLLKQQAELYRQQKRGLMQKLLTGEWRVNSVEQTNQEAQAC